MKKILFATTALVASAGVASAEGVSVSGFAELGLFGGTGTETQLFTDIDVTFKMSGEADNGLSFGTAIDLDESEGDAPAFEDNSDDGGISIYLSYGPAKLTVGDTDGAFDAALQDALIGGSIADDNEHAGYTGNSGFDGGYDGQVATLQYSFEGFTGYASLELDDAGEGNPIFGLGGKYSVELASLTIGVGVGYQGYESNEIWGISLDTTFDNGLQAIVNYASATGADADFSGVENVGLALGYTLNEISFGANYNAQFATELGTIVSGLGLTAAYDLGGGLEAQFGYGMSNTSDQDGEFDEDDLTSTWSLGLAMSF